MSDLTWDVAGGNTVRFLSGYRDWENTQLESDVMFMPADFLARTGRYDSKSQSYELQLISPTDELSAGASTTSPACTTSRKTTSSASTFGLGAQFCGLVPAAQRPACAASGNKATATVLDFNQDAEQPGCLRAGQRRPHRHDRRRARRTLDEGRKEPARFAQAVNNPFGALLRAPE